MNLFAFDINSHIYRAYKKNETSPDPDKCRWDCIVSILRCIEYEIRNAPVKFDRIIMILDVKGDNFRHVLSPIYKANRPPEPEDLAFARKCVFKLLHLKGFPVIRVAGVEADDVIGTLAKSMDPEDLLIIFSRDKDLMQLICANVKQYDGASRSFFDEAAVLVKFGLPPEKLHDYLSLLGDKADNVTGLNRCGTESSVKLLLQYTLAELLEDPSRVLETDVRQKKVLQQGLIEQKDTVLLAKSLIALKTDIELPDWRTFVKSAADQDKLVSAFSTLGLSYYPSELDAVFTN
jgi:DNA polymerase-1